MVGRNYAGDIFFRGITTNKAMARGQQKLQSQAKNLKKQQDAKKQQNHDGKAAAAKALIYQCSVCKVSEEGQHFCFATLSLWVCSN